MTDVNVGHLGRWPVDLAPPAGATSRGPAGPAWLMWCVVISCYQPDGCAYQPDGSGMPSV